MNGELQGYRLYPGTDRDAFRSLGLRPGDLVTEIDGQPLDEPSVAIELFQSAVRGQPVQFSILRDGETVQIEVTVD